VSDCVFCDIAAGVVPAEIVLGDETAVAFLDRRPLFKGHVLVIPREHYETLADLPAALVGPLFTRVQRVSAALPTALGAQGSFVALNNVVSQSVPHVHVHVVPRTRGDGLRGFFWPRQKYADDAEAASYAQRISDALAVGGG
jgi:histidine triad (HIT) family protein